MYPLRGSLHFTVCICEQFDKDLGTGATEELPGPRWNTVTEIAHTPWDEDGTFDWETLSHWKFLTMDVFRQFPHMTEITFVDPAYPSTAYRISRILQE